MKFGLMFFASSEESLLGDKYRLVLECAKYGDQNDFSSIWVPERHFTKFGCLYPNPAVLQAGLATVTRRIRLQAGSVVMPIHNPLRVAEEWSMVDNLSNGRAAVSFASGWNPDDFAYFPDRYKDRHEIMYAGIEKLHKLWQGGTSEEISGNGKKIQVKIYPTPVQKRLPVWITAAGNPETFKRAGMTGANVLTHMLDQTVEQLTEKIDIYRAAREENGHDPSTGIVSLMLHTFIGEDGKLTKEQARKPYCDYLKANASLLNGLAQSRGNNVDITKMSPADLDDFVNFLYERFASTKGLIGTAESCMPLVEEVERAGVNEIACLLDFGPPDDLILDYLPNLNELREHYAFKGSSAPREEKELGGIINSGAGEKNIRMNADDHGISKTDPLPFSHGALPGTSGFSAEKIRQRCKEEISGEEFYKRLNARGVQLSGSFKGIQNVWRGNKEALGKIRASGIEPSSSFYKIHPALLDACNQVLGAAISDEVFSDDEALFLPVGLENFEIFLPARSTMWSHAVVTSQDGPDAKFVEGNVQVFDEEGNLVIRVTKLKMQRAQPVEGKKLNDYDDWLYELTWDKITLDHTKNVVASETGNWLIFADLNGIGDKIAEELKRRGNTPCLIYPGQNYQLYKDGTFRMNPEDAGEIRELVQNIISMNSQPVRGIVHLWSADALTMEKATVSSIEQEQVTASGSLLSLVKAIHQEGGDHTKIFICTKGVYNLDGSPASVAQAPVWGLGRVFAVEFPKMFGGLIDLDPEAEPEKNAQGLCELLYAGLPDQQFVLRKDGLHGLRLKRTPEDISGKEAVQLSSKATYLITGGLGNLGLKTATWMVAQGARTILLTGRSSPSEEAQALIDGLEKQGARIEIVKADVASEPDMNVLFREIEESYPPLKGVFHAAGVTTYEPMTDISIDGFLKVLRPKVNGTWILHKHTMDLNLDFFVSISSLSPVWGSKNLAHYAASNNFLDVFAHYRKSIGLPATTINLGPIGGGGMATELAASMVQSGLNLLKPEEGIQTIGLLLNKGATHKIVADINWSVFKDLYESNTEQPLLEHIASKEQVKFGESQFMKDLLSLDIKERRDFLLSHLRSMIGKVLGIKSPESIALRERFFDLGLDSMLALELKNKLEQDIGHALRATTLFNHPTLETLAEFLSSEILAEAFAGSPVSHDLRESLPDVSFTADAAVEISAEGNTSEDEIAEKLLKKLNMLSE